MKTLEAKPFDRKLKARKSTVCIDRARGRRRRLGAKSNRNAGTQKLSNSLIRFRCSNSCFLLETGISGIAGIAGHERLLLAKWHPMRRKKLRNGGFSTPLTGMKSCSRVDRGCTPAPEDATKLAVFFRFFSSLFFDISIKNSVQACRGDLHFRGLFRVKIRKMAQRSNDLSRLPLSRTPLIWVFGHFWLFCTTV